MYSNPYVLLNEGSFDSDTTDSFYLFPIPTKTLIPSVGHAVIYLLIEWEENTRYASLRYQIRRLDFRHERTLPGEANSLYDHVSSGECGESYRGRLLNEVTARTSSI